MKKNASKRFSYENISLQFKDQPNSLEYSYETRLIQIIKGLKIRYIQIIVTILAVSMN